MSSPYYEVRPSYRSPEDPLWYELIVSQSRDTTDNLPLRNVSSYKVLFLTADTLPPKQDGFIRAAAHAAASKQLHADARGDPFQVRHKVPTILLSWTLTNIDSSDPMISTSLSWE